MLSLLLFTGVFQVLPSNMPLPGTKYATATESHDLLPPPNGRSLQNMMDFASAQKRTANTQISRRIRKRGEVLYYAHVVFVGCVCFLFTCLFWVFFLFFFVFLFLLFCVCVCVEGGGGSKRMDS